MTKRDARDWTTPLLLTLSLHLLAFTLFINHRLFAVLEQPQPGALITLKAEIDGDDPDETDQDEGAAPGPQSPDPEPAKATVAELMRDAEKPPLTPLPQREPRPKPAPRPPEPTPLEERLKASAEAAGVMPLDGPDVPRPASGAAGSRGEARRQDGLRKHGGGADTEDAVAMGLRWLASVQDHDGGWDSDGYMQHYLPGADLQQRMAEGVGLGRNDVGITALCMLAFTGAGNSDLQGAHRSVVARARAWLLKQQRVEDGGFGLPQDAHRVTFYGHALATLALADLCLLTGDASLRAPLQRAVQYLARCQGPGGGWDYAQHYPGNDTWQPSTRNDLSISGWAALALAASREAGIEVPTDTLARLVHMLREHTRSDGDAIYANEGIRAMHRGVSMMSVSNLCRRLLGEPPDSETQQRQLRRISDNPPDWSAQDDLLGSNMYHWYYGSLAMLLSRDDPGGEDRWRSWNIALKRTLLPNQVKDGDRKGSFEPGQDYWARGGGGRLYSTAICVLTLQIYYRYEPELIRAHAADLAPLWQRD